MYIYIIRHGETYGNITGDDYSETDLTPLGEEQASLLGKRFKNTEITKIYVSPYIRALKTAREIIKYHKNISVCVTSEIFEQGTAPDYTGIGEENIKKILPNASIFSLAPLGNETEKITFKRSLNFINRIKKENDNNSSIVIVAHGSINSYLVHAALDIPVKPHFNFSHVNTGVTLIEYLYDENGKNTWTKLRYLNDTSHLNNPHRDII